MGTISSYFWLQFMLTASGYGFIHIQMENHFQFSKAIEMNFHLEERAFLRKIFFDTKVNHYCSIQPVCPFSYKFFNWDSIFCCCCIFLASSECSHFVYLYSLSFTCLLLNLFIWLFVCLCAMNDRWNWIAASDQMNGFCGFLRILLLFIFQWILKPITELNHIRLCDPSDLLDPSALKLHLWATSHKISMDGFPILWYFIILFNWSSGTKYNFW